MKKLLLRLAYGILNMYNEKPTSGELENVILFRGVRYVVTDCFVTEYIKGPSKLELVAWSVMEVPDGRN